MSDSIVQWHCVLHVFCLYHATASCGPRAGSVREGGFAPMDEARSWKRITIPVLMITMASAEKLKRHMQISEVHVPQFGLQVMRIQIITTFTMALSNENSLW